MPLRETRDFVGDFRAVLTSIYLVRRADALAVTSGGMIKTVDVCMSVVNELTYIMPAV